MDSKPITNRIRKYTYESLTRELLALLRYYEEQRRPVAFWHPLLLLGWTMEFAEQSHPAKVADPKVIGRLLKDLKSLEPAHRP